MKRSRNADRRATVTLLISGLSVLLSLKSPVLSGMTFN